MQYVSGMGGTIKSNCSHFLVVGSCRGTVWIWIILTVVDMYQKIWHYINICNYTQKINKNNDVVINIYNGN